MRNPYVLPILLGTVCLLGCASSRPPRLEEAETYYQEGLTALKKKRCLDAVEKLQRVVSNFSGSRIVADAQYYLAEAQFCSKDYVNAVFEYQRLIDTYPASEWIDEAQYQIAESYFQQLRRPELDQKETREALNYFRYFLEDNPASPLAEQARQRVVECRSRLARKQYLNGELYQRQGYLDAAVMAYDEVVRSYSDTPTYYHTLLRLGEIAQARGDEAAARGHWEEALKDSEEAEVRAQAQERLAKLQAGPAK
jgi:outer membrane protein assembly factor BamD